MQGLPKVTDQFRKTSLTNAEQTVRFRKATPDDTELIIECHKQEFGAYFKPLTPLETVIGIQEGLVAVAELPGDNKKFVAIVCSRSEQYDKFCALRARGWWAHPQFRRFDLVTMLFLMELLHVEFVSWDHYLHIAKVRPNRFDAQRLLRRIGFQPDSSLQVDSDGRAFVLTDSALKLSAFAMIVRMRLEKNFLENSRGDRLWIDVQHPVAALTYRQVLSSIEAMEFDRRSTPYQAYDYCG